MKDITKIDPNEPQQEWFEDYWKSLTPQARMEYIDKWEEQHGQKDEQ